MLSLVSCNRGESGEGNAVEVNGRGIPALKSIQISGYPDSVAISGDRVFVSCIPRNAPMEWGKKWGFIVELNRGGDVVSKNAFPEVMLNSPKGMAVFRDHLYIADINHIVGIDLNTGNKSYELPLPVPGGQAVMDSVITADGLLYTAPIGGTDIFIIDVKKTGEEALKRVNTSMPIPGIHGLALDGARLYVAGFGSSGGDQASGKLWSVDLESGKTEPLSEKTGRFDGIAVSGDYLYFSDWERGRGNSKDGAIRKMNLKNGEMTDVTRIELGGVADFLIDEEDDSIWIPVLMERKIIHAPLYQD